MAIQRGNAVCVMDCPKNRSSGLEGLFNFQVHEAEVLKKNIAFSMFSYTWYKSLPLCAGILPIGLPLQISQTLRHPDPPPTIIVCPSKARQFSSSPRSEKCRK